MKTTRVVLLAAVAILLVSLGIFLAISRNGNGIPTTTNHPLGNASDDAAVVTHENDAAMLGDGATVNRTGAPSVHNPWSGSIVLSSSDLQRDRQSPNGAFEGQVLNAERNTPIANAGVLLVHNGATLQLQTNAQGMFALEAAEPGAYELVRLSADGFASFAPIPGQSPITFFARAAMRVQGIKFYLQPRVSITVVVKTPQGETIPNASVQTWGPLDARPSISLNNPESVRTNPQGEAVILATEHSFVEVSAPGYNTHQEQLSLAAIAQRRWFIRLRPSTVELDASTVIPQQTIAGRVLAPDREPIEGAWVVAQVQGANEHASISAVTDAAGSFSVQTLAGQSYTLTASARGYAHAVMQDVPSGRSDVTLTVQTGAVLTGRVSDAAAQQPVTSFAVIVYRRVGVLARELYSTTSAFDGDGSYRVQGLGAGHYTVVVAASGYAASAEQSVEIPENLQDAVQDFQLQRGTVLRGTVTDRQTHQPIVHAEIVTEGLLSSSTLPLPVTARATTGLDGTFTLAGISAGLRSIEVSAERHHTRIISGIEVGGSQELAPLQIELTPTTGDEEPHVELVGIGAVLRADGDALAIANVFPGSGAAQAGLVVGDHITAINGTSVVELGFEGSVQRIRGPENSTVSVTVRRGGDSVPDATATPVTETVVVVTRRRVTS